MSNFKFRFNRILNLALGLAMLDGGLVIGIQVTNFLLVYFFLMNNMSATNTNVKSMFAIGSTALACSIIYILNISAIIYRITGFARGVKHTVAQCYLNGLRNVSALMVLFMLAEISSFAIALQISKISLTLFPGATVLTELLIRAVILLALPYGILTCATVVVQRKNPFQALTTIYNYIRSRNDFLILAAISAMYGVPNLVQSFGVTIFPIAYIKLFAALWFLFCHITTLVVYIDTFNIEIIPTKDTDKPSKTVII